MKVLLIEDEEGLIITLTDRLRSENFDVKTAADGEAGLSIALRDSPKIKKRIFNKLDKLKNVRQVNKLAYYEQPNLFNMFN